MRELDKEEMALVAGGHGNHQHTTAEKDMEKEMNDFDGGNWHCTKQENGQIWCVEVSTHKSPQTVQTA